VLAFSPAGERVPRQRRARSRRESIIFAHVGLTTIRTINWHSDRTSASHSTRCSGRHPVEVPFIWRYSSGIPSTSSSTATLLAAFISRDGAQLSLLDIPSRFLGRGVPLISSRQGSTQLAERSRPGAELAIGRARPRAGGLGTAQQPVARLEPWACECPRRDRIGAGAQVAARWCL
jgi:hypothetical protein